MMNKYFDFRAVEKNNFAMNECLESFMNHVNFIAKFVYGLKRS